MTRRDLFVGFAMGAGQSSGQETAGAGSIYIPQAHKVEDRAFLHDFMDEYSFVDLVTAMPEPWITHIPAILDRKVSPMGTIYGHIARNNAQTRALFDGHHAVIVFRGPHAYISPSWYKSKQSVPTWNFGVVHASGKLQAVTDKKQLRDFLGRLIEKNEHRFAAGSDYDFHALPDSYIDGMLGGIVGFSMEIEKLEGKFKLGQERADRDQVLEKMDAYRERTAREFSAAFYQKFKKS